MPYTNFSPLVVCFFFFFFFLLLLLLLLLLSSSSCLQNELTGEHTCIMFQKLDSVEPLEVACNPDWLHAYSDDFRRRFISLLSYEFRTLPCELAFLILSVTVPSIASLTQTPVAVGAADPTKTSDLSRTHLDSLLSIHDMKRLEWYAQNMLDYHVIIDLIPHLARLFFLHKLGPKVRSPLPLHALPSPSPCLRLAFSLLKSHPLTLFFFLCYVLLVC